MTRKFDVCGVVREGWRRVGERERGMEGEREDWNWQVKGMDWRRMDVCLQEREEWNGKCEGR